jgi:hypothetical protein
MKCLGVITRVPYGSPLVLLLLLLTFLGFGSQTVQATTIGSGSCEGVGACELRRDGDLRVGDLSCNGDGACSAIMANVTVGSNACVGKYSCTFIRHPLTVGYWSCLGPYACRLDDADMGSIGRNSCNGDSACRAHSGSVGNNSCNGDGACSYSSQPIGDCDGNTIYVPACSGGLQSQTIRFDRLANQTFGAAPFQISATASSRLPVSFYALTPDYCSVSGSTVTLKLPGLCVIVATQEGNAIYDRAISVGQDFRVLFTAETPLSGSTCNGAYSGGFKGNITVSQGQTCVFAGGVISGDVVQKGGKLTLFKSTVDGNVNINDGEFVIGPYATIKRNLTIEGRPNRSTTNLICGSLVLGNLQFQRNGDAVLIGATGEICAVNAIEGNMTVKENSAAISIVGNIVEQDLTVEANTVAVLVQGNSVSRQLMCQRNASISGRLNTAAKKEGQCAQF